MIRAKKDNRIHVEILEAELERIKAEFHVDLDLEKYLIADGKTGDTDVGRPVS